MLNNLQSYIFDNIQHLKQHDNSDITVITDKKFNQPKGLRVAEIKNMMIFKPKDLTNLNQNNPT